MAGWMINCREYASLLSQSLDRPMSFWEKVSIKLHQIICPACKHIQTQFDDIRLACRFTPDDDAPAGADGKRLSEEVCEQMRSALRKTAEKKNV
jgi:hypothetical protein